MLDFMKIILWFKVFKNKGKFHNLDKFLVKMKVDDNFFKRRSYKLFRILFNFFEKIKRKILLIVFI